MSKKQACKNCKLFVEGDVCPGCGNNSFTTSWQGRLYINDQEHSLVAHNIGTKIKGEYALKVK